MGRGLDVFLFTSLACVQFSSLAWTARRVAQPATAGDAPPRALPFSVAIARGTHLFPFRTEPLSPSAPMVLGGKPPGRVGRRRSLPKRSEPLQMILGRLFSFSGAPRCRLMSGFRPDQGINWSRSPVSSSPSPGMSTFVRPPISSISPWTESSSESAWRPSMAGPTGA